LGRGKTRKNSAAGRRGKGLPLFTPGCFVGVRRYQTSGEVVSNGKKTRTVELGEVGGAQGVRN